ncbi:hypothetical protein GCM10027267_12480 [Paramicrobacterium agarici]
MVTLRVHAFGVGDMGLDYHGRVVVYSAQCQIKKIIERKRPVWQAQLFNISRPVSTLGRIDLESYCQVAQGVTVFAMYVNEKNP